MVPVEQVQGSKCSSQKQSVQGPFGVVGGRVVVVVVVGAAVVEHSAGSKQNGHPFSMSSIS